MAAANHTIKHFSLHRLEGVELRVVADIEQGVLPLIEAECAVVTRLAQEPGWPHEAVTLFILADMTPLQRQLQALGRVPAGTQSGAETTELLARPIVNVYDLASPTACHIFVNRAAMSAAGYWGDPVAIQGLLAHEHAHPLTECPATAAVRQLQLNTALTLTATWAEDRLLAADWAYKAHKQIAALAQTVALVGPREVLANAVVLKTGFVEPLLHLNRQNVANLLAALAYRPALQAQLAKAVAGGQLSQSGAAALALIGDLQGSLLLTMEVAAFLRQQQHAAAAELLAPLQQQLFPRLDPVVGGLFQAMTSEFSQLAAEATGPAVTDFVHHQLRHLTGALAERSLVLTYEIVT